MTELDFSALRHARAHRPAAIAEALAKRRRRPLLRDDGKLFILAADHPGRGALAVGNDPMAMADRYTLLLNIAEAMQHPGVDGFLGTPDLIEDLTLLGALEDKIVVGSMNRGGLRSAVFEMDDRFTAYDPEAIVAAGLDFAKLLLRINYADNGTIETLEAASHAVTRAAALKLPIMLEPFVSEWSGNAIRNDLSTEAVIRSIAITTALGASSAYSWLKIPLADDMERVMKATTLPTLLLGGDTNSDSIFERWRDALQLPGVYGLVAGRALLYPPDSNVVAAVSRAAKLVHG